jgi:hypothetical protein
MNPTPQPAGVWINEAEADFSRPGARDYYSAIIDRIRFFGGLVAFNPGRDVAAEHCDLVAKMDFINGAGGGVGGGGGVIVVPSGRGRAAALPRAWGAPDASALRPRGERGERGERRLPRAHPARPPTPNPQPSPAAFENSLDFWQAGNYTCTCAAQAPNTRCIASIHTYTGAATPGALSKVMATARARGFQATFITSDPLPNPYATLPPFWPAELSALCATPLD